MPDVRMVLLKGFDEQGFVFYTNFESAKGREILSSMKAAMCFHWKSLRRQVRMRGPVEVGDRRGGRRLFRDAAARQPHRRLGLEAVAAAGEPLRAGEGGGEVHREISRSAEYRGRSTGLGSGMVPQQIEFWHDRPFRACTTGGGVYAGWQRRGMEGKTRLYP